LIFRFGYWASQQGLQEALVAGVWFVDGGGWHGWFWVESVF